MPKFSFDFMTWFGYFTNTLRRVDGTLIFPSIRARNDPLSSCENDVGFMFPLALYHLKYKSSSGIEVGVGFTMSLHSHNGEFVYQEDLEFT